MTVITTTILSNTAAQLPYLLVVINLWSVVYSALVFHDDVQRLTM